jgi:ketosteroid isomerase-like protein
MIEPSIDLDACARLVSDTPMPRATTNHLKRRRRRTACGPVVAAVLALASGTGAVALQAAGTPKAQKQKHEIRHEIDQLEDAWRQAELSSNTAAMEKLLADDYLAITASGTLQTKDQSLANLRTGKMHFTTLDLSDRKVRFYGTTALVTSLAEVQGSTGDGELSGSYRYTRVYARDAQGAWKIVSFEASKIHEPGEHDEHK